VRTPEKRIEKNELRKQTPEKANTMKPIVAIVGRPNVGKSTLFNRIASRRYAIVHDEPGVTRDRNYIDADWNGKSFHLLDTGGYTKQSDHISQAVLEQVFLSIDEADAIVFLVDVKSGITDVDAEVASILRKYLDKKKIFLAVNKIDNEKTKADSEKFRKLGVGELYHVSALNGDGVADLLDDVVKTFPVHIDAPVEESVIKLAVIGRPNVGKSSFVNAILGTNRQIVTEIAGTTRDAIDTEFTRNNEKFMLIDTAGLRKKARVDENVEFFSTVRTEKAIERADVVIAMFDATQTIDKQDLRVINLAVEKKRGVVIAVNKWDLIEKETTTPDTYARALLERIPNMPYIPIVFISATTKQRIFKAIDMAKEVWENRRRRISTSALNDKLLPDVKKTPPWSKNGREIKIKYITQLAAEPPLIAFYAGNAKLIEDSYKKFLEKCIRKHFKLDGTPIELQFRLK
jgi:GTPase